MGDEVTNGVWVPALVIGGTASPWQRARNGALYSRLLRGVPPEERTGEPREGIGLHVFRFSVPLADVAISADEIAFNLKPDSECLRRLCSYISDHFDSTCDADDEVTTLRAALVEACDVIDECAPDGYLPRLARLRRVAEGES